MSPRWRKVLNDLWYNKTRTLLVVLSIAVGVFAVGLIAGSRELISHDMQAANMAANPASAVIFTEQSFDDDLVQVVRHMPGVGAAEGIGVMVVQVRGTSGEPKNTQLYIISDFHDIHINKITPVGGAWPPPRKTLLLERTSLPYLNTQVGGTVTVELPDGLKRDMRVSGAVNDVNWASGLFDFGAAYITSDTARWLGQSGQFTQLRVIVADDQFNSAHIKAVVADIRDRVEKSGRTVSFVQIPDPPGKHWADQIMQALMLIMGVLGVISLLMSAFLVVNTIGALLTQQTRQIGVMKAIGARRGQISGMYLTMVFIFSVLSLSIAVPLGAFGAHLLLNVFANLFNFDPSGSGIPPRVLALEMVAGLAVPLIAAFWPIFAGTRITVREAVSSYGMGQGRFGRGWIDRLLSRIHFLSRPFLLSLRNTFRRRGRLALTLSTLTLGGAMLIGVLSVRASLLKTLDGFFTTYKYDVTVIMERPYRINVMQAEALTIPGVTEAEGWAQLTARRVLADRTKSENITITAPPAGSKLLQPKISAGRWLLPGDENAIVIAADLLNTEPDLKLGDDLMLDINGRESAWHIVGIAQVFFVDRTIYANYDYLSRFANQVGRSGYMVVVTSQHDAATHAHVAKDVRDRFKRSSIDVSGTQTVSDIRTSIEFRFNILIYMLLLMAVLLAVVGGLGLMGTMSINVLERTREIGVLRAIGASNGAILRIVMGEGMLVGVVSWLLGAVIAFPFGLLLDNAVGDAFLRTRPAYVFSIMGALLWLGIVIVLAALASALPAWNAVRVTVRDVLAYE